MIDLIETYRRIKKSSKRGQGTRLSPEECWAMVTQDNAIEQAIAQAEEDDSERKELEFELTKPVKE